MTFMIRGLIKSFFKLIAVLIAIGMLFQGQAVAQDDPNEKYLISTSGLYLVNISWAFDSSSLVFQERGIENSRPIEGVHTPGVETWRQYSVLTQQTTTSDFWPLQPNLTPTQMADFEVNSPDSFIFASPDNCWIVYPTPNTGILYSFPLGIANMCTNQHIVLDDLLVGDSTAFDLQRVHWSDDSSALTREIPIGGGGLEIYYISGLDNLNNPTIVMLNNAPRTVNNTAFYTETVFDVNATGSQLILYGSGEQSFPKRLVRWDMDTNTGVEIPIEGEATGSTFFGQDQQSILFVDEAGLKKYHVPSSQVTLLNPAINSTWIDGGWTDTGAFFSPNGRYVALYDFAAAGRNNLYVMDIPQE